MATRSETGRLAIDETKSAYKTTELIVAVAAAAGVLIAAAVADNFDAPAAWRYVTYIAIGYMIARGLAKAGSRHHGYDEPGGRRPNDG